jgi:hypothetical protein
LVANCSLISVGGRWSFSSAMVSSALADRLTASLRGSLLTQGIVLMEQRAPGMGRFAIDAVYSTEPSDAIVAQTAASWAAAAVEDGHSSVGNVSVVVERQQNEIWCTATFYSAISAV